MCFSAAASFGAGIALTGIGIASYSKVKEPSQYPFASIPLIFGIQQGFEGVVWLSATNPDWAPYQALASYGFLGVAQIIWPLLFPIAFSLMEKDESRKKIMKLLMIPGILIAGYFLYCLAAFNMETRIIQHHVFYDIDFPKALIPYAAGFYLAATVVPPLFSKEMRIKLIGIILLAGYLVARIFFQPSLISVWCFFGIGCSIVVYLVLLKQRQKQQSDRIGTYSAG
jgi:hypothetical protein